MSAAFQTPTECPVCGEPVPRGAKACPHCGADERAGWNEDAARYDGLDLPDAAFAEDQQAPTGGDTPRIFWAIVVVGPLILVLYALIFR